MYTTIYSISESPRAAGQIWVGTDDGNVQLTRDGGKTWNNLTKNLKLGPDTSIAWVEASRHNPAVAYVAVDRHTYGDMAPYVLKTADYGQTWTKLIGPATPGVRGYAHVVKEDRLSPDILFVGTEFGLFVSRDRGANWEEFRPGNFPAVAVRDIAVATQGDDLVLATHGRGIWIIDDISPLRALTPEVAASDVTLIPSDTVRQLIRGSGGWPEGDATYVGENSVDGAVITYYQKARHVIGRMKLEILDSNGKVVDTLPTSKRKGLNRVVWAMRTKPPQTPPAASLAFASTQGQRVMPGTYTVRLTKGDKVTEMPLVIGLDKRAQYTVADRQAQYDAAERVKALFARMTTLTAGLNALKAQALETAENPATSPANKAKALDVAARADALRKQVVATTEGGAITGEERLRENMDMAYGAITSTDGRPTNYALARVDALEKELAEVEAGYAALKAEQATALNKALSADGVPPIDLAAVMPRPDDARGGPAAAIGNGMVGTRYQGSINALRTGKKR
jgi:hypothetical protein